MPGGICCKFECTSSYGKRIDGRRFFRSPREPEMYYFIEWWSNICYSRQQEVFWHLPSLFYIIIRRKRWHFIHYICRFDRFDLCCLLFSHYSTAAVALDAWVDRSLVGHYSKRGGVDLLATSWPMMFVVSRSSHIRWAEPNGWWARLVHQCNVY